MLCHCAAAATAAQQAAASPSGIRLGIVALHVFEALHNAHEAMVIMMLRISCDVDAVRRIEHSSRSVLERSATME